MQVCPGETLFDAKQNPRSQSKDEGLKTLKWTSNQMPQFSSDETTPHTEHN